MKLDEVRNAFSVAARAFDRGARAPSCAQAMTNLRLGREAMFRGRAGMKAHVPPPKEGHYYAPAQRDLMALWSNLSWQEQRAHEQRLEKCSLRQLQVEHEAARAAESPQHAVDKAWERQQRKRSKNRRQRT